MTIELLDVRKQWMKIKAGFGNSRIFQNPPARPHHPFVNGVNDMAAEAQGINARPSMGAFTGKSFSQRKK